MIIGNRRPMAGTRGFRCILVLKSSHTVSNVQRCLTTLEPRRHLSMLLLTLVTASRRLSLARRRAPTNTYASVVRSRIIGQRREDGGAPSLQKGEKE